jgi:hypothetical protein
MIDSVLGVMDFVAVVGHSMVMLIRRDTIIMVLNGELILNFSILHTVIVH